MAAATLAARLENLPGFNPHAAAPEHVYPLDSLLPADVGRSLFVEAEELMSAAGDTDAIERLRECVDSLATLRVLTGVPLPRASWCAYVCCVCVCVFVCLLYCFKASRYSSNTVHTLPHKDTH